MPSDRQYVKWMGVIWSMTRESFDTIIKAVENDQPFDMDALGARVVKRPPTGVYVVRLNERKGREGKL